MNWSKDNIESLPETAESLPVSIASYRKCPGVTRDPNKQQSCGEMIYHLDPPYCKRCGFIVRDLVRQHKGEDPYPAIKVNGE
jgi:ribosomal protein L37E